MNDDDETVKASAVKTLRDLRAPPVVSKELLDVIRSELSVLVRKNSTKTGLAVLVGIISNGPCGVETDLDTMKDAFEELGLAVWSLPDASNVKIAGVTETISQYRFPSCYKFVVFYATGHGGSLDSHAFISTTGELDENGQFPRLFIEEAIISPLLPKNSKSTLSKDVRRLFLFDCCLVDDTVKGHTPVIKKEDVSLPPRGNVVVAYSTSMTATSRADPKEGGVWTRFLAKNMKEVDLPITTVLDLTWEDTVRHFNVVFEPDVREGSMDVQGPHYTSCAGLMWLRHPDWDLTKCRDHLKNRKPDSEPSLTPVAPNGLNYTDYPPPTVGDIHPPQDLQPIANKVPRQADMMNALSSELHNWDMIIHSLQVPMSRIQSIKSENSSDYMRMAAGLNTWISTRCYKPTTWQGLINVLSEIGKEEAVSRVEQRMRAKFNDYNGRN